MKLQRHCIYTLDFNYLRITERNCEIEFRGSLNYHTLDLDLLKSVTKGFLELNGINVFLSFLVQRNIDLILSDIDENDLVMQRPILINRLKVILRQEFQNVGLEFIDFKNIALWIYGFADHGISKEI